MSTSTRRIPATTATGIMISSFRPACNKCVHIPFPEALHADMHYSICSGYILYTVLYRGIIPSVLISVFGVSVIVGAEEAKAN